MSFKNPWAGNSGVTTLGKTSLINIRRTKKTLNSLNMKILIRVQLLLNFSYLFLFQTYWTCLDTEIVFYPIMYVISICSSNSLDSANEKITSLSTSCRTSLEASLVPCFFYEIFLWCTVYGGNNVIIKVIFHGLWKTLWAHWIKNFYAIFGTYVWGK